MDELDKFIPGWRDELLLVNRLKATVAELQRKLDALTKAES